MKKLFCTTLFLFSTAALLAQIQLVDATPSISVSGKVERKVTPDFAELAFGIEGLNESVDVAYTSSAKNLEAALETLKRYNVPSKDIKIGGAWLYTLWEGSSKFAQTKKYRSVRSITVVIAKVGDVEPIMKELIKSGVTQINRLEYKSSEFARHKTEVRLEAVRIAKSKADAMASELGAKIGRPLKVGEDSVDEPIWGNRAYNTQANVIQSGSGAHQEVEPGQITISATVHATFALE